MRYQTLAVACSLIGCASATVRRATTSEWPAGNWFRSRAGGGVVAYSGTARVRLAFPEPVYVAVLELRPTRDSLDVKFPPGVSPDSPITSPVDLAVPSETTDRLPPLTASAPSTTCTTVTNAAGYTTEFCPASQRTDLSTRQAWDFRNRVFLLVSNAPLQLPASLAVPYHGQRTLPPVSPGKDWIAIGL